ncbi:DNA mismatch repair protein MutS [Clostridium homopropionicum DSM 5847]|uniref:DNA mismatch repair protein MutS n=1 Tax=Clostridium homopropionicum DSM 5847 TaxID=1121318 RepID=A0A0L6Z6E4_9CLOT|nr:MutS family DNA mismatch repair protein [Clostridium homopropionicum]KOA18530.1 DNA mismatch repair protein MutS [Clostridium homopropionicum DSM 5847]SFF65317.1 MutS domain III [Clostridium homopropionicum]
MEKIKDEYEKRKEYYSSLVKKHQRTIALISNLRLVIFLVGVVATIFLYMIKRHFLSVGLFIIFLSIFIILVKKHNKLIEEKKYSLGLYQINENSMKRIEGQWKEFKDTGEEFYEEDHNYSVDLDIFGRGSLFQWINTASTFLGRKRLSEAMKKPCKNISEIYERQEAINELAEKLDWRQKFTAEGVMASEKVIDIDDLFKWSKDIKKFYCSKSLRIIFKGLSLLSIIVLILPFIVEGVPYYVSSFAIMINILILMWKNDDRAASLGTIDKYEDSIKSYYGMIAAIEGEVFKGKYLKKVKSNLIDEEGNKASKYINKLSSISEMISMKRNAYFAIINIITLWDYHCMFALEQWKNQCGKNLQSWIESIAEFEALSSLAIIKYDNPSFVLPKIEGDLLNIHAKEMGHPLLTSNRVSNDFKMEKPTEVLLITGSNMSGKSTFLRTVGINLVLAYMGAPVCAKEFTCPIMNIYTCMRISDNLDKNISSFYAELLRVKKIVEATKSQSKVFFLLDEIFKGTNSVDRHTGAKVLINRLREKGAAGLVSTHDLELGELEKQSNGKVKNYHFREFYKANKINFDYKLREGISTTKNALYLIRMIGIDT